MCMVWFPSWNIYSFYILDEALQPYIDQINDIETAVNILEQSAYKIDAYSKKLGMCRILVRYESVDSLSFCKFS